MKRAKHISGLVLALCLALTLLPGTALAHPFADVPDTSRHSGAVQYVYEHGLMNGTGETAFSPDRSLSRGMLVTILYLMEGSPAAGGGAFADVPAGERANAAA